MTNLFDLWGDLVNKTAQFIVRDFPNVEKEDVTQELYLFILETPSLKSPNQVGATKALARKATEFAWSQRKEHLMLSPQYSYRTSDVKRILETVYFHEDWQNVTIPDDAKSEFNDVFLELNSDVSRAIESLGLSQQRVIFERYALGECPQDDTSKKRLYRALVALTDKLNWYQRTPDRDYVGTRKVLTNAHSRHNIDKLTNE